MIQDIKKDLILFTIFLVIADIVQGKLFNIPYFDTIWINLTIGTYIAVIFYHVFIHKMNMGCWQPVIKYAIILFFQYNVNAIMNKKNIMDDEIFITSFISIIIYSAFIYIEEYVPKIKTHHQDYFNNLIKISMVGVISSYIIDSGIYNNPLLCIFPFIMGYSAYYICNNILFDNKKF